MAPCKPTNLNKRAYPGNASVIGPTRQTTCSGTSTTCCSFIGVCCGSASISWTLGCRCQPASCPCCRCCRCCTCTVCDRTIPSGRWKSSEQWEAKKRDAWGPDTCSSTAPIGYTTDNGTISSTVDCYGILICNSGGTRWLFAVTGYYQSNWYNRNGVLSCVLGGSGWFVPTCDQLKNPGYTCRYYWAGGRGRLWSSTDFSANAAWSVYVDNFYRGGTGRGDAKSGTLPVVAFRTV